MRASSKAHTSLISRYSSSFAHLRVRNSTMAGRPEKNSARLRQALSTVYASETRSGSREFQPSSAARALTAAVSRVNGGNGGRPCAGEFTSEVLAEPQPDGARRRHDGIDDATTDRHGALRIVVQAGIFIEGILDEQFRLPIFLADTERQVDERVGITIAENRILGLQKRR